MGVEWFDNVVLDLAVVIVEVLEGQDYIVDFKTIESPLKIFKSFQVQDGY